MFWLIVGFTLIIFAWFVQILSMWNKNVEINYWFVFLYAIGALMLVIDSFKIASPEIGFLNILTVIFSSIVLLLFFINKREYKVKKNIKLKKNRSKK